MEVIAWSTLYFVTCGLAGRWLARRPWMARGAALATLVLIPCCVAWIFYLPFPQNHLPDLRRDIAYSLLVASAVSTTVTVAILTVGRMRDWRLGWVVYAAASIIGTMAVLPFLIFGVGCRISFCDW